MNIIVTVYVDCLNEHGAGDFVRCKDCGEIMLMQIGGTACSCESEHLEWVDEAHKQYTVAELEKLGYIIEEK